MKKVSLLLALTVLVTMFQLPLSYATKSTSIDDIIDVGEGVSPAFRTKYIEVQQKYDSECLRKREAREREAKRRQEEAVRKQEVAAHWKILKKRNDYMEQFTLEFFSEDWKTYKPILVVLNQMIEPLMDSECKGGEARFTSVVDIMNDLVKIHKEETYCSLEKIEKLEELLNRAKKEYNLIRAMPSLPFKFYVPTHVEPEVLAFFREFSNQECRVNTVGVNVTAGIFFTGDAGLSGGISRKDILGKRHAVLMAKYGGGQGAVLGATAGYNSLQLRKKGTTVFNRVNSRRGPLGDMNVWTGGLGVGGAFGARCSKDSRKSRYLNYMEPSSNNFCMEAGVGLGLAATFTRFVGKEIFSLPGCDLTHFAKKIGIQSATGKLPDSLRGQIDNATTRDDYKQIKRDSSQRRKEAKERKKGYTEEAISTEEEEVAIVFEPSSCS